MKRYPLRRKIRQELDAWFPLSKCVFYLSKVDAEDADKREETAKKKQFKQLNLFFIFSHLINVHHSFTPLTGVHIIFIVIQI